MSAPKLDLLEQLLSMERMFLSQLCEEPTGPHKHHTIVFSKENLSDLADVCEQAREEILRLRGGP